MHNDFKSRTKMKLEHQIKQYQIKNQAKKKK